MKKTRQLVTIGLLATGLVALYGCSSDAMQEEDGGNNNGNIQPVELKIQTSVEMARAATGTEGVVKGDAFAEGDKIAVFSDKNTDKKAEYTLGNTTNSWTVTSTDHIYLTGETANIYAVYPSTLTLTSGTTVGTNGTVDITSLFAGETSAADDNNTITLPGSNPEKEINAAKGEKDYMYATATASATSSTASLTMKHALAMVTFKFYKDDTFAGTGKLTKIELKKVETDGAFKTGTATMNISSGTIDASSGSDGTLTRFTNSNGVNDGYTIGTLPTTGSSDEDKKAAIPGFSMLVYPNTSLAANKVKAVFTIDNVEYPINIPAATGSNNEWAAGYNTTYTVLMKGKDLGITSISVTKWQDATVGTDLTPIN